MTDDQLIESLRARVAELEALPGNVLARQLEKLEAERDALAAELKALREHEPFCWTTYPPSGRYSKCKAEVDLWERNSWTIVPLYARPVPARELTDEDIGKIYIKEARHIEHATQREIAFARAIERHMKGEGK